MSDVKRALESSHRLAAEACGLLALTLERGRITPAMAERIVRQWRAAADRLERDVLKRSVK